MDFMRLSDKEDAFIFLLSEYWTNYVICGTIKNI